MSNSFYKFRDTGNWGVSIHAYDRPERGSVHAITTKSGESRQVTIECVVRTIGPDPTGRTNWICMIQSTRRARWTTHFDEREDTYYDDHDLTWDMG